MSWPSRVFLSGPAVSLVGDGLAVLAIPLLVLELTRSPLISGLSAAAATLGYLVVGLPAGVLVDRLDAWRVLVTMDAARTAAFAALYLLRVANRTYRQLIVPRDMLGRVTSTVRLCVSPPTRWAWS